MSNPVMESLKVPRNPRRRQPAEGTRGAKGAKGTKGTVRMRPGCGLDGVVWVWVRIGSG